jgi:predicted ATP-dependent endonuclease of OLD family
MTIEGTESLKLTSLEVENILRLKAVNLSLEDGALIVEGANEQGKSSVLRSLEILLAGMGQTPDEPIHGDADKGRIVGRFGDVVVSKTFGRGKRPALRITSAGMTAKSPQKLLDTLLDHVALDPLRFMATDPKEQLRILSELMGVNESEINERAQEAYDQRREQNRIVRDLEGSLKALDVDPTAPAEEIAVSDLMAELERIQKHNAKGEHLLVTHREVEHRLQAVQTEIGEVEKRLTALRSTLVKTLSEEMAARDAMLTFEPLDDDDIRAKIATVDETNRKVRDAVKAKELGDRLADERRAADELDETLKAIESERQEMREKARERLPVEDLAISDSGIDYKGKPLAQAGSSAQLRVSLAVAMALNKDKRIKLLLIDDAEKLDAANTRLVLELAREAGFQVLMARVGDGRESAVLIEDGQVADA